MTRENIDTEEEVLYSVFDRKRIIVKKSFAQEDFLV